MRVIDLAGIDSKETLLTALGDVLRFPDYYGQNWDAFEECLRDIADLLHSVDGSASRVLVLQVRSSERLSRVGGDPLLDIWSEVAPEVERDGVALHLTLG